MVEMYFCSLCDKQLFDEREMYSHLASHDELNQIWRNGRVEAASQ